MRATIYAVIAPAVMSLVGCDRVFQLDDVMDPLPPDAAVDAAIDAPSPVMITRSVASNGDDAYQDSDETLVAFPWVSLRDGGLWGAFRFELPEVPHGAQIESATLEMFIDSVDEDTPVLTLASEASAAPAAFTTAATDISGRTRGQVRVAWSDVDIGAGFVRSPLVTALVQERVDDASWATSTSLVVIFESQAGSMFECRQHDHPPAGTQAARLHLTFVPPVPPP